MPNPKKTQQADPFPFAYQRVRDPESGEYRTVRLVSPQIPEYILTTGDTGALERFYAQNKKTLTEADHKYMKARLHTAWKVDNIRKENLLKIGQGTMPAVPQPTTKKGFTGLDLKYSGPQTSNNGCWSCGLSLLLKSRGVDLSQEEIRAWRPAFEPGQEQRMSPGRRMMMDMDSVNSVYENADLVQQVLPNSALTTVTLNALPDNFHIPGTEELNQEILNFMTEEERAQAIQQYEQRNGALRENARNAFKAEMKQKIGELVRQGLIRDKSPIVLNLGSNHFVTITGISKHGNRLRIEDSLRSNDKTTQELSVDELIDKYMISRPYKEVNGITMTWLKDLPAPQYEHRETQKTQIYEDNVNASSLSSDGSINLVEVPGTTISVGKNGAPSIGQLKGQELTDTIKIDQTGIQQKLGGRKMYATNADPEMYGEKMYIGSQQTYYPKKMYFLGDPNLTEDQILLDTANTEKKEAEIDAAIQGLPQQKIRPNEGSIGAFIYDQKQELLQQNPDPAYFIANIYAANKVLEGKEAPEGVDKKSLPLTPEDKTAILEETAQITPLVKSLLPQSAGQDTLEVLACADDPQKLVQKIDSFRTRLKNAANSDLNERKAVIDDAFQAMQDTATGRNYFGVTRSRNRSEYTDMMEEFAKYKTSLSQGEPDGAAGFNAIQKGLKYISDKKTVRSTETGAIRFDNTMRILKQLMPAAEFTKLCNSINRARGVNGMPTDKNFVSPETYAPATMQNYVSKMTRNLPNAGFSEQRDRFAMILAAREIARQKNPRHPEKAIIVGIVSKKQDEQALKQRANEIKRDPNFRAAMDSIRRAEPEDKAGLVQLLSGRNGQNLEEEVQTQALLRNAGNSGPGVGF